MSDQTKLSGSIRFDQLSHKLLAVNPIKKQAYNTLPGDAGLKTLFLPFLDEKDGTIWKNAINFDKQYQMVVATDGHRIALLPGKVSDKGPYTPMGKLIEDRYPDYHNAIPRISSQYDHFPVNCRALRSYLQAAKVYANQTNHWVAFKVQNDWWKAFNVAMLQDLLLFFERLGHTTINVAIAPLETSAALFYAGKTYQGMGEQPIVLQMPVAINQESFPAPNGIYYPTDYDAKTELRAYWSFTQNTVICDGLTYRPTFDSFTNQWTIPPSATDRLPPYVLKAISKLTAAKSSIPILNNVSVQDDMVVACDLYAYYRHQSGIINELPNGIYRLHKNALLPEPDDQRDFPREDLVMLKRLEAKKLLEVTLPLKALEEASHFVTNDDLRPAMTGVKLDVADKRMSIVAASDGHVLYSRWVAASSTADGLYTIIPQRILKMLPILAESGYPLVLSFDQQYGYITAGPDSLVYRVIDERFPDYDKVVPQSLHHQVSFKPKALSKAINALPKAEKNTYWTIGLDGKAWVAFLSREYWEGNKSFYAKDDSVPPVTLQTGLQLIKGQVRAPRDYALGMPVMGLNTDAGFIGFNYKVLLKLLNPFTDGAEQEATLVYGDYNRAALLELPPMGSTPPPAPVKPAEVKTTPSKPAKSSGPLYKRGDKVNWYGNLMEVIDITLKGPTSLQNKYLLRDVTDSVATALVHEHDLKAAQLQAPPQSPKFKVNDLVTYNGQRLRVAGLVPSLSGTTVQRYQLKDTSTSGVTVAIISETDLTPANAAPGLPMDLRVKALLLVQRQRLRLAPNNKVKTSKK